MPESGRDTILVTGAAGFVGTHLASTLASRFPTTNLVLCDLVESPSKSGISRLMDVTNPESVERVIAEERPRTIVHLAALASVGSSHVDPSTTYRANVEGTSELLKAAQRHSPGCHFIFVSSAEVYGESSSATHAIDETHPLRPLNPYAESKAAAETLVLAARAAGLHTTILRPFNHTGPGQNDKFVVPAFCSQIARIERGLQLPILRVGELDDGRDFVDVSDIVDLYVRAIEHGTRTINGLIVNACSGRAQRVGDILNQLLQKSIVQISVEVDPARLRPNRQVWMLGNPSLAKEVFGWQATKPFIETLSQTLNYWRDRT